MIFFWRTRRELRDLREKHRKTWSDLAAVRETLRTVAAERDHAHSLLRQVRTTGYLPFGDLYRAINGAVDLGSESANEDAQRRALAELEAAKIRGDRP